MKVVRRLAALVLSVALAACGNGSGLTAAERQWCRFTDDSEESAARFDLIFEAGLALGLNMDGINATASALRDEYEAEGMTSNQAIAAVSDVLLEDETYIEACQAAYEQHGDG